MSAPKPDISLAAEAVPAVPAGTTSDDHGEAELVKRLQAGEDAAFEQLVREMTGRLLAVAGRISRSHQDAEDAVQEAFLSAFKAIESFDGRSTLGTWLHRIVVNAALARARKQASRREISGDGLTAGHDGGVSIEGLVPAFDGAGLHISHPRAWVRVTNDGEQRIQQQVAVRSALAQLPDEFRTVLMLRDIEGLDSKAVAAAMDISDALVRQRLHRGRQALMKLLEPMMTEDGQ